jgi:glycosyltransferase involved in cell wall biosynthesis
MSEGGILVVLPTLGERLTSLEQTLNSVDEQRSQVALTLVVVLPASAHEARELATRFGATVVEDPGDGISHAINVGIDAATDESFYAWIGDDDLFRPRGLLTLRTLIRGTTSAVLAYGACDYVNGDGRVIFTNRAGRLAIWLLPWGPDLIPHPGSLIRIDAMRNVGLFDVRLKYAMDLDLCLKLRAQGSFVSTKVSVSAFRWHADSMTVLNRRASSAEAESVKNRHLPRALRSVSAVWNLPVRVAAAYAARSVNRRATIS